MRLMKTEDAVGQVICHDITQIIKDVTKDAVFRKGHIIKEEDIMAKRPGTGISPVYANIVIGRKVKIDLPEDTILQWDFI